MDATENETLITLSEHRRLVAEAVAAERARILKGVDNENDGIRIAALNGEIPLDDAINETNLLGTVRAIVAGVHPV